MATTSDDLRTSRENLVRRHMEAENEHDYEAAIGTFTHPRYEIIATDRIYDGNRRGARLLPREPYRIPPTSETSSSPCATPTTP
jgi:hypothetical protein